jgi:CubicO group peptidase (beta-lactamase class C family)
VRGEAIAPWVGCSVTMRLLALVCCVPLAWSQDLPTAQQMYDGAMQPDQEVRRLANADRLFSVRAAKHGSHVQPLPVAKQTLGNIRFEANEKQYDLFDYLAVNRVAGLLIVKNGQVLREEYELGIGPETHWPSFSIAKSVSSTLIGAAVLDGKIRSLDDPVTRYVPALKGGAYEGVSVRNVLQMASGVKWDETYTDPKSDRRKLLEVQLKQLSGSILKFMSTRDRAGAPGTIWNYNSGETFVVGAVVQAAVGKPLATYLSEKIWIPSGMEQDAQWWLESPDGLEWGGGGISATLRDFGRFGLFVLNDGVIDGKRVVPAGWFDVAGSAKEVDGKLVDYGYLWWPLPKGDPIHESAFEAQGIFGQRIYINRKEKLVVVILCARSKPTGMTILPDDTFFGAIAKALH